MTKVTYLQVRSLFSFSLVSFLSSNIFFFRTNRSFIQVSWTWLQSAYMISCRASGGISHSSTDLVQGTNLAHSWASLLQDLLERSNLKSTKLRLRSLIWCSNGPISEFWRVLFSHKDWWILSSFDVKSLLKFEPTGYFFRE